MVKIGTAALGATALALAAAASAQMPQQSPAAIAPLPGDHGRPGNGILSTGPRPAGQGGPGGPGGPGAAQPKTPAPSIEVALDLVRAVAASCKQYPLGAAVVNAKGEPILVYIPDGSQANHAYTAIRKAYSAITFGANTSTMVDPANTDPAIQARLKADPNLMAFKGGVLLRMNGQVVGALGVSGAEPGGHDDECAANGMSKVADRLR